MIVTVGELSVRVTLIDGKTGRPADGVRLGPKSRLTPFTSRTAGRCLDLSVTRVGGSSWDAILRPGDFARIERRALAARERFPFTRVLFGPEATRKSPGRPGAISLPLLSAGDSEDVSVFMSSAFLVVVDHRLGRAQALARIRKGRDEGLFLAPVIQAVLGLSAPDHGALMLHAASVALFGGRLFIGGSGAGKSTIAASAERGTVLSDDGSWCGFAGGRFLLYPTPFSQIDPAPKLLAPVILTHVYFLEQGGDNRIVDMSPGRAMTMLLRNHIHFFRFMGQRAAARGFELAGEICAGHPVSTLVFTRGFDPKTFFEGIAGEREKAV
jgi:hypothetical protein